MLRCIALLGCESFMKPTPFYEQDGITIYHGDCAQILPFLDPVDLLLTDPPYGIGADRNLRANKRHGSAKAASRDYGEGGWDAAPPQDWMLQMARSKANKAVIWGGNYFNLPPTRCVFVWDKNNGSNCYADCELAWTNMDMAVRKFKWTWHGMIQEHMGAAKEERHHPTQKPLALMVWCIEKCGPSTIIDPFMGSGTTLVAAKSLGKRAIGIERELKYCKIAVERLRMRLPRPTPS
jgi:DNA modification methylase